MEYPRVVVQTIGERRVRRSPGSHTHEFQTLETAVVTTTAGRERAFPPRATTRAARVRCGPLAPALDPFPPSDLAPVRDVRARPRPLAGPPPRRDGGSARPLRRHPALRGGDAGWGGHDRVPLAGRRRRGAPRALPHPAARVPPRGRVPRRPRGERGGGGRRPRGRGETERRRPGARDPPSGKENEDDATLADVATRLERLEARESASRSPPPSAGPSSPLSATAPSFPRAGRLRFSPPPPVPRRRPRRRAREGQEGREGRRTREARLSSARFAL